MMQNKFAIVLAVLLLPAGVGAMERPGQGGITTVEGLRGWWHAGSNPTAFAVGVDRRITHGGWASARIQSLPAATGFGSLMQVASAERYRGKRIRFSAWVRAEAVARNAGLWLRVDGQDRDPKHSLAFDAMADRPIAGTRDWRRYEIVLDVPAQAASLAFGAHLSASGTIWVDDVKLEIVDASVPVTDASASPPRNLDFEE